MGSGVFLYSPERKVLMSLMNDKYIEMSECSLSLYSIKVSIVVVVEACPFKKYCYF